MIVKMNDVNQEKYNQLFNESYKYLKECKDADGNLMFPDLEDKEGFASLPEYYSHMNDFFTTGAWKYVFLPLDENEFKINLEDRSIIVPSSFSKQVSVQSDQLAETIIFSVDRYFDYMDLANTNIYVQWQNAAGEKSATRIFMIDLDTPDKIRFAWPISDAITKQFGKIHFSVRFFRINEQDKMIYSLNTTEYSFNIAPAHQESLNLDEYEEQAGLFNNVIINSLFADKGISLPQPPSFIDVTSLFKIDETEIVEGEDVAWENLVPVTEANLAEDTLTLCAEANTIDNGDLIYTWYYLDNAEGAIYVDVAEDDRYTIGTKMIKFAAPRNEKDEIDWSLTYIPGQRYYESNDPISAVRVANVKESNAEYLYRRFSTLTINKDPDGAHVIGKYFVKAENKIQVVNPNPANSSECVLPAPVPVTIITDLQATKNFLEGEEGNETCVLAVENTQHGIDVINYTWYKDGVDLKVEDATASYTATTPGYYSVSITSAANRETTDPTPSAMAKVTKHPVAPVFEGAEDFNYQEHSYILNNLDRYDNLVETFSATVPHADDELYSEGITYQWYISAADTIENQTPIDNQTNTLIIHKDLAPGFYHCEAINFLNGDKAPTHSHTVGMVVTIS